MPTDRGPRRVTTGSACRSCHEPVWWIVTEGGKRMPLDMLPSPRGNVRVIPGDPAVAQVLGGTALAEARSQGGELYVSHFATCENAAQHRRR
jgi:hypothetical protein